MTETAGRLVVVGTPLGNLGDLSDRAVKALTEADVIACEDTRRTAKLLRAAGIERTQLVVANDHTETQAAPRLVKAMLAGDVVAAVTDAGMPSISDPGTALVSAAADAGIEITVVPGPTAASAALAVSGLPSGRWVFEGFLPRKGSARTERLAEVAAEQRTVVLYEAPHRMVRTVDDLLGHCEATRPVAIGRELTKLHEECFRGTLAEVAAWLETNEPRGEFVIVLGGAAPTPEATDEDLVDAIAAARATGSSTRDAVAGVAERFAVSKRRVYDLATTRPR